MQRKPGGYRKPTEKQRETSKIGKQEFDRWFQQIWNITGASTKHHPAPFPLELAVRLKRPISSPPLASYLKKSRLNRRVWFMKTRPSMKSDWKKKIEIGRRSGSLSSVTRANSDINP